MPACLSTLDRMVPWHEKGPENTVNSSSLPRNEVSGYGEATGLVVSCPQHTRLLRLEPGRPTEPHLEEA